MSNFMPKLGPNDFSDNSHPQIDQSVSSCCQGGGNEGSIESFKSSKNESAKTTSTVKKSGSNVGLWITIAISILLIILSWWFYDKLLDLRNKIIDKIF